MFGPRASMIAGGGISVVATVTVAVLLAHRRGASARSYLRPARLAQLARSAA
jgi:hypothetical protein